MADPYLITAGGLVLLGLGCFGHDLYNAAAPAKDQHTDQQWAAETVNIAADAAAVVAVLTTVNNYYVAADNYINERTAIPEEPKRGFSPILYALAAVEALELLTGFGTPYRGDDLKEGAKQFTALGEQLQDTIPNSSWRSSAAQIYVDGVQAGTDAAAIIAQIDAGLADLADHCADFVIYLRLAFGALKALLLLAYTIEILYYGEDDIAGGGKFAFRASILGGLAALGICTVFGIFALKLQGLAYKIAAYYEVVGELVVSTTADTLTSAAVAPMTSIGDTASTSTKQRDLRTIHTDAGGNFADSTPKAATETPDAATPAAISARSALTVPIPGPLTATATPRGRHTRPRPLVDPATAIQQDQGDVADADVWTGGRAPVETASVGSDQDARPRPARVMAPSAH